MTSGIELLARWHAEEGSHQFLDIGSPVFVLLGGGEGHRTLQEASSCEEWGSRLVHYSCKKLFRCEEME